MEPHKGRSVPPGCCHHPPGQPPSHVAACSHWCSGPGLARAQVLPGWEKRAALPLWSWGQAPRHPLQGLAWARCSGEAGAALGTSPRPAGHQHRLPLREASSRRSSAAPSLKAMVGLGCNPQPLGSKGRWMVAGERHVDCNLSAGRTFLSEGPWALRPVLS